MVQYKSYGVPDHLLMSKNLSSGQGSPVRKVNFDAKNLTESERPTEVEKWNPKPKNLDHL